MARIAARPARRLGRGRRDRGSAVGRRLAFIHLPRTGGTAVQHHLESIASRAKRGAGGAAVRLPRAAVRSQVRPDRARAFLLPRGQAASRGRDRDRPARSGGADDLRMGVPAMGTTPLRSRAACLARHRQHRRVRSRRPPRRSRAKQPDPAPRHGVRPRGNRCRLGGRRDRSRGGPRHGCGGPEGAGGRGDAGAGQAEAGADARRRPDRGIAGVRPPPGACRRLAARTPSRATKRGSGRHDPATGGGI